MSERTPRARHRAARRPVTPLTTIASGISSGIEAAGRRTAAVATTSGLAVSMLATGAAAAPHQTAGTVGAVDVGVLTASARAVLDTAPVVTVAPDASWTFTPPQVTAVAAKAAAPEPTRTSRASRSESRQALPASASAALSQAVSGSAVIEIASRYLGTRYVHGGSSPSGFDCSGFTSYVYAQLGVTLPHSSSAQHQVGVRVSQSEARPGDIIWSPGHVAIYAGDGMQIEASGPAGGVVFRSLWQSSPVFIRVA